MKIGIVLSRRPDPDRSPLIPDVARLLTEWGAAVDLIVADASETDIARLTSRHDLYVLKSTKGLALSLGGALHAAGAITLNPYPIAAMCRDRIVTTRMLATAGVPVPESHVAADARHLAPLLESGPLIVKPVRGSLGRDVRVVREPSELRLRPADEGLVFAQRYHEPDGADHKLYCIGGQVFGVLRPWPARTYEQKLGQPFTLTAELRDLVLRCARSFGIELFGLDVITSGGRPYVVDFSSFPGFKGVPDAALRLADYIYATAARLRRGEPATEPAAAGALVP